MDARFWDERYGSRDRLFSGRPNGVLVTEVTGLPPGQALDVGCGEGADALWLARQGWQVTGVDISEVALRRAAEAASGLSDRVAWARADLAVMPPPACAFDLVTLQYFPLPHQPDHTALRGILNAVAPGGTLLFAGHDLADLPPRLEHDIDPGDFYQPDEVARLLGPDWTVLRNETRPRTATAPAGTHHTHDTVLRAQRLG
ncbi:SAM-dependent methyltransferase [Streptomyces sp. CB02923]|uniref:class I SAM-dependent methyltransferase n=1 Tax=Streptomyces sp. CB02923 TaxID=1718985 RepID=UPI00093A6BB5|nr:class I SAM-dependent methyltransferase [Streptomyces sp. CB02923]OKI00770.1 SAM-dependent methyltransferase [Streptomyces sp. CB02923]